MLRTDYKRLGEYIEPIDERNRDLSISLSQGINNNKYFQEPRQVAENSANDKIVRKGYFAYNRATTRNGEKISIAYREGPDCTVSSAYQVFRIIDEERLNPHYLLLWFKRPRFDRYARFKSHGSAHEFFEWDEMCNVMLPVPPIEEQRHIVAQYQAVENRIRNNERLIASLEATAQAIFRHHFFDNIDPNNLPDGWRMGTLEEVAEINSGKTCVDKSDIKDGYYPYPVAGASGVIGYSSIFNFDERLMTTGRVGTLGIVNRYNQKMFMADNVLVVRSNYFEYCYQVLKSMDYSVITKGGVQSLITQTDLKGTAIIIPSQNTLSKFEEQCSAIYSVVEIKILENSKLTELQSLLLAKMGQ